jgi:DNA-directed RNA polymerase subunit RPC12/RpoP
MSAQGLSSLGARPRMAYVVLEMDETPRPRKTLSLKSGVIPAALEGLRPTPAAEPREVWKCKPCGAVVDLTAAQPGEAVRCGNCGARLGLLEQFLESGDEPPKVRARKAVLAPPPPAKPAAPPTIKVRPRRTP